ncbi:hypothetical protein ACHAQH_007615 [Verticillium albo-atrum]
MDDPWGSPWETHVNESNGQHALTDTKPEPPPPAFFSTTPNNLNIPSSQSAWLEDDSFGDWASPEAAQPAAAPWGAWGGSDATPSDGGQLTPRYESKRKSSIPKWPSSRSTSPGQRNGPLPKKPSSDHLSHDPWASDFPPNERDPELAAPLAEIQHLPPLPTALDLTPKKIRSRASEVSITIHSPRTALAPSNGSTSPAKVLPIEVSTPPILDVESAVSPTTSTSDGNGAQDVTREDSPITPVEDGQAGAAGERKASKVHQLVVMYDGIARKSSVPLELVPPPKRSASQSPTTFEASLPAGPQALDCTDGDDMSDEGHPAVPSLSRSDVTEVTEKDVAPALEASVDDASELMVPPSLPPPGNHELEDQTSDVASGDDDSVIVTPGIPNHEPFHVDLEHLGDLFDFPATNVRGTDVEVPDRIITDSFESVSERRMWYRLSRYESLRRYDAGNDDNYVRITWASSTVRSDAMKTVRRWMEEDSIGQRPFRTGLAKGVGGHGFGWDKASTQVDLEKFFSRRRPEQAATVALTPRSSMSGLPHNAAAVLNEIRPVSLPPPAANSNTWDGLASFGGSFGGDNVKTSTGKPPISNDTSFDAGEHMKGDGPPSRESNKAKAANGPSDLAIQTSFLPADNHEDEDDEWGEMVTPSIDEFPEASSSQIYVQPPPVVERDNWGFNGWENNPATHQATKRSVVLQTERNVTRADNDLASPASSAQHEVASDASIAAQIIQNLPDLSYMLQ